VSAAYFRARMMSSSARRRFVADKDICLIRLARSTRAR